MFAQSRKCDKITQPCHPERSEGYERLVPGNPCALLGSAGKYGHEFHDCFKP